jgi:FtsZ-interacting cell division protein YlmF
LDTDDGLRLAHHAKEREAHARDHRAMETSVAAARAIDQKHSVKLARPALYHEKKIIRHQVDGESLTLADLSQLAHRPCALFK